MHITTKSLIVLCLFLAIEAYAAESSVKPKEYFAGYEILTTCADCSRRKQVKELVLWDSEGQKVRSWRLGTEKKDKKVVPHNDPRVVYTIDRYKSSGISLDHEIYQYEEVSRAAFLPNDSQINNSLSSVALLRTRSASILDFTEFDYPYDDPQPIQPQSSTFSLGMTVLDDKGDVILFLDKEKDETLAYGSSWISEAASVVGLLHFEEEGGFYVNFYDFDGNPTHRLPPQSFAQHADKVMIKFGSSSTVLTPSGHFVLAVSYPKKGEYKGVRKYNRGTFVLDTKNGRVDYFNETIKPKEAIARFLKSAPSIQKATPASTAWPKLIELPSGFKNNFSKWGAEEEKMSYFLQLDPYCGEGLSTFVRGDFNGDGDEDEMGWYLAAPEPRMMPALYFASRFSVETEREKFTMIEEREPVHWKLNEENGKRYHFLGQALELVKKDTVTSSIEDRNLELKNDAVKVHICEKSAFIAYWDGSLNEEPPRFSRWGNGDFKKYWIAD